MNALEFVTAETHELSKFYMDFVRHPPVVRGSEQKTPEQWQAEFKIWKDAQP